VPAVSNGQKGNKAPPVEKPSPPSTTETTPSTVVVKRRDDTTDEDLRKQLLSIPETGFNQQIDAIVLKPFHTLGKEPMNVSADIGPSQFKLLTLQIKQPEQFSLPWRAGPDCTLGKEDAERLHVLSRFLRDCLGKSAPPADVRPDPKKLKALIAADRDKAEELTKPQAIPTLMQLLQAENTPIRLLLVEMLADIKGKEASHALAQRALFDLSPEVREKAVQFLATRPAQEYQSFLVEALRYPWPAAADHAAEALVALNLTALVPDLVQLLKEPPPGRPVKKNDKEYDVKELVRINHLCNCVLCHAPSFAKDDLIRGRVPIPGEDPPPLYYNASSGFFVRANTTYLRQDFSVVKVFLEKKDKPAEKYAQRDAVLFALREITKANPGDTYDAWFTALPKLLAAQKEVKPIPLPEATPTPLPLFAVGGTMSFIGVGRDSTPRFVVPKDSLNPTGPVEKKKE
jgi:hypothetical protein